MLVYQPAPGKSYIQPKVFAYNMHIGVTDDYVYLDSKLSRICSLNNEPTKRIQKDIDKFGNLEHHGIL